MAASKIDIQAGETNTNDGGEGGPEAARRSPTIRVDSLHKLPSERVPWESHFPLLTNCVTRSSYGKQPVDSMKIEGGVSKQSAQLSANFFVETGLWSKEKRAYLPSEACIRFVKMHNLEQERAKPILREVIAKTWFAEVARGHLLARGAMREESLRKELGIAAEVSDYETKERAFSILVEYLVWTGLIIRDGENVRLGMNAGPSEAPAEPAPGVPGTLMSAPTSAAPHRSQVAMPPGPAAPAGDWVHKSWPDCYVLSIKPTRRAVARLEKALEDLKDAVAEAEDVPPS